MIKEIESLMVHWGEQLARHGLGAGIGSQMGSIMEWKGTAPRGVPGSRIIRGGAGMDLAASEVEAVVAALERGNEAEKKLGKFARQRYCLCVTVREQMQTAGIAEGADRTYRNWVRRLHERVLIDLTMRTRTTRGYERRGGGDKQTALIRTNVLGR